MIHKYEHAIKKFTTFNANFKKINEKENFRSFIFMQITSEILSKILTNRV